ncbi:MAG: alpha-1,3-galactosidase B [Muribaculaceae bacterium]|nr:alpha-1,3-galactosidase B [Muribaculaceae bacterium]
MKRIILSAALAIGSIVFGAAPSLCAETVVDMTAYGLRPDRSENLSPRLTKALTDIFRRYPSGALTLRFAPGVYNFHPKGASRAELHISNHDQDNPKSVAFLIQNRDSVTIDGAGADFMFHGRMLPVAVIGSAGVELRGFSIDFAKPHITQVEVLEVSPSEGITFRTEPWVDAVVSRTGAFSARGEGWTVSPRSGIAFDGSTRHVVYRTSDLWCPLDSVVRVSADTYRAPRWTDSRLTPGTRVALRGWGRPTPGIFLSECVNPRLTGVSVHYAEGMGLLAQLCDSVTLSGFNVCLRSESDPRYFTTQADATHFSGCKGLISSVGGLYEGMMDDAINVHGTYLKVIGRVDSRTVRASYMHQQSYGFPWGEPGDSVQILSAPSMQTLPGVCRIESVTALDTPVKTWEIRFTDDLPAEVGASDTPFGLENLSWTPEVVFADNVVRNNRARGALFSTPRPTLVERNLFDHTSGTAILLCGDCMGWYETGACRSVTIRGNRFINALTNQFQFTEAVISIYPEIHRLDPRGDYFHSGITIEDNDFATFDAPILYAKSVRGLAFRGNRITPTADFAPFHPNRHTFRLIHVADVNITDNDFSTISPSFLVTDN